MRIVYIYINIKHNSAWCVLQDALEFWMRRFGIDGEELVANQKGMVIKYQIHPDVNERAYVMNTPCHTPPEGQFATTSILVNYWQFAGRLLVNMVIVSLGYCLFCKICKQKTKTRGRVVIRGTSLLCRVCNQKQSLHCPGI